MAQTKTTEAMHPLGEGGFSFAASGGRVRLSDGAHRWPPFLSY